MVHVLVWKKGLWRNKARVFCLVKFFFQQKLSFLLVFDEGILCFLNAFFHLKHSTKSRLLIATRTLGHRKVCRCNYPRGVEYVRHMIHFECIF